MKGVTTTMSLITYKRYAKPVSYGRNRSYKDVKFIVIHYTSGKTDTVYNELDYFATGNTRSAGAHYFVDYAGRIGKSIPMTKIAWSVGGNQKSGKEGEAKYYNICTNANSVSIELCGIATREPSAKQIEATRKLIKAIKKYCPNVRHIIRHWDVNGKMCPARMCGKDNNKWKSFKKAIEK